MSDSKWWSNVEKDQALNTRMSFAVPDALIHDHCAIVRERDDIPENDIDALIWLHKRKAALVDLVWHTVVNAVCYQPSRVLDLGCGVGGTLSRIYSLAELPNKLELVGITESEEHISKAAKVLPEATWIADNFLTYKHLPPNWFHLIIAIESTEHVGNELGQFMTRAYDLLAPNGILAVVAHSWTDTPPNSVIKNRLNQYFEMRITSLNNYKTLALPAELELLDTIDLTLAATLYWKERFARTIFHSSNNGWVEQTMYSTLTQKQAAYQLFLWHRKP